MKPRKLLLLGITIFSATALWNIPAAFVYQYAPTKMVQVNGISGTVWNGTAEEVVTKKITINNISWSINLLKSLTSLSIKSDIEIEDPDLTFRGLAGVSLSQTFTLEGVQFESNGAFVSKLQKFAKLNGEIKGSIQNFELAKGKLPVLEASYHWKQGELLSPMRIRPAGDYSIIVTPSDKGLIAKLSSNQAPLILSGNASIGTDWKYNTNIKIKAASASSKGIMNLLKLSLGRLEKDGSAIIKHQGQLEPFY
jgi:general secretion pathway protein N